MDTFWIENQGLQDLLQVSHDHRSFECNLSNCEQKPEKVRTLTGFEPVTSQCCDTGATLQRAGGVFKMKHLTDKLGGWK